MKKLKKESGAVTVFLSIIIVAMIVIIAVLIDIARIKAGSLYVKRAVETAVNSTLAGFNNPLKENFGIFALNENNPQELQEIIKKYLYENLNIGLGKGWMDLYDFKIESIKVTPVFNLTENEVLRNQILEYVKYRAPKELAEGFLEKLKGIAETGKVVQINEQKMEIDNLYIEINKYCEYLEKLLEETKKFEFLGFKKRYDRFIKAVTNCSSLQNQIKDVENAIRYLVQRDNNGNKYNSVQLQKLYGKLNNLNGMLKKENQKKDDYFKELKKYLTQFSLNNRQAYDRAREIGEKVSNIKIKINSLKEYMKSLKNGESTYLQDFIKEVATSGKNSIVVVEKSIPKETDIQNLMRKVYSNKVMIDGVLEQIEVFQRLAISHDFESRALATVEVLKGYKYDVYIKYKKIELTFVEEDPRQQVEEEVKEIVKSSISRDNEESLLKKYEKILPSRGNKAISPDFSKEDSEYLAESEIYKEFDRKGDIKGNDVHTCSNILNQLETEVNFKKIHFSKNAFGYVKNFCSRIEEQIRNNLTGIRNEIYINEYIIGSFNNAVPVLKDKTSTLKDLRGNPKKTVIKYETEYILWGNTNENINLSLVKGQILLIRFGIDTANVYKDPVKVQKALTIATVAGGGTFGLGVPIAQNLILCSWGMKDAITDLKAIMRGESVPLFGKFEKDNKTAHIKNLPFSYHDYLRVFLLFQPSKQKMDRIADLIQLRTGKELKGFNTCLRVDITVSIKYLFLTSSFIPKHMKMPDGKRHKIRVVMYQGY